MVRSLEKLQKQYSRAVKEQRRGPGGRHGPHGPRAHGKPKNAKATIKRIWGYVAKYKLRLVFVLICMLASTVASLLGSYMLAPIVNKLTAVVAPNLPQTPSPIEKIADGVITRFTGVITGILGENAPAEIFSFILAALIILGGIYLVGIVCTYLQSRLMLSVSLGAVKQIRNDLFGKLQRLPVRYFDSNPTGELMSRFTNDIDNIEVMLNNSLTSLISGTVTLVGTFVFMVTTNWILTLITVVFLPIFAKGGALIGKRSSSHYGKQQAALGAVNGYMEETITGQKIIKVFNHEETCVEEFKLLNDDMREKQINAQFWGGVMGPIMGNVSQVSYAATVGIGGVLVCTTGFSIGALTVFAGYSRQFSMPINMISAQMATVFAALAGAERVFSVMDEAPEAPDGENAISAEGIKGEVVFENVTFGYRPDKTVLQNLTLYAHAGQKIAFVGSTGAGKTTVTNLLTRFYDIEEGKITIDGRDVKEYRREELRGQIAMVLQDTHLFSDTVMENIRYGRPDATDEEVIAAAKTASAHSFITHLPNGYQTRLEGDGTNLSQGQRQLLNIARAAISKAPILVLDEATSSVDTRTERHIERGMDSLMENRTTFVIAHRLSTVRNANAIMVLEAGKIIERGTHEQLLALKGRYYELYTGKKELD